MINTNLPATIAQIGLDVGKLLLNSLEGIQNSALNYADYSVGDVLYAYGGSWAMKVLDAAEPYYHIETSTGMRLEVIKMPVDQSALEVIRDTLCSGAGVEIVAYGDSTVQGSTSVESYNNWPNRLASCLSQISGGSATVYNEGVGGKKVIDDWAADNFKSLVLDKHPTASYLFVCFGLNDIKTSVAPVWNSTLFYDKYRFLLYKSILAGVNPVLVTPIILSAAPIRPVGLIQGELMATVRKLSKDTGVPLLDINKMLTKWQETRNSADTRLGDIQSDGTHFNDAPNLLIGQYMASEILSDVVVHYPGKAIKVGINKFQYADSLTVSYDYKATGHDGVNAVAIASAPVAPGIEAFVWLPEPAEIYYVSPGNSRVSGQLPRVSIENVGSLVTINKEVNFGTTTYGTNIPAEQHMSFGLLPAGVYRLNFRCGIGTYEIGYWKVQPSISAAASGCYSVPTGNEIWLPERGTTPVLHPSTSLSVQSGGLPRGTGFVVSTQYTYRRDIDSAASNRADSVVVLREPDDAVGLYLVQHTDSGVLSVTNIKTAGTGSWGSNMSVQVYGGTSAQSIIVRVGGSICARSDLTEMLPLFGETGGIMVYNSKGTDPDIRQRHCSVSRELTKRG